MPTQPLRDEAVFPLLGDALSTQITSEDEEIRHTGLECIDCSGRPSSPFRALLPAPEVGEDRGRMPAPGANAIPRTLPKLFCPPGLAAPFATGGARVRDHILPRNH